MARGLAPASSAALPQTRCGDGPCARSGATIPALSLSRQVAGTRGSTLPLMATPE